MIFLNDDSNASVLFMFKIIDFQWTILNKDNLFEVRTHTEIFTVV